MACGPLNTIQLSTGSTTLLCPADVGITDGSTFNQATWAGANLGTIVPVQSGGQTCFEVTPNISPATGTLSIQILNPDNTLSVCDYPVSISGSGNNCTCTNNNSITYQSGTQSTGASGPPAFATCASGSATFVSVTHNGQTATAPNGNIPMGAGTIGFMNGVLQLNGVPPGTYSATFVLNDGAANFTCQHNITIQGGNSLQCLDGSSTIAIGGSVLVAPGMVQGGSTGFNTNINQIIAGQSNNSITSISNPANNNQGIQFTGLSVGTNVITFSMQDGSTCDYTIIVEDQGGGNECQNYSTTIPVGSTITVTPGQVQSGATAYTQPNSDIVQGETDPNNSTSVSGVSAAGIDITGTGPGTTVFTVRMANGQNCTFQVTVTDANTSTLTCTGNAVTVAPGGTISGSQVVTGGSPGYTVTGVTGSAMFTVSSGNVSVSSTAPVGQYQINVTVQDTNGDSRECSVMVTVQAGTGNNTCFDSDSTFSIAPATATPGTNVAIVANVNPNSGGLSGYFVRVKDPNGMFTAADPTFLSSGPGGQTWTWQLPSTCTNGTYTVCIFPPAGTDNCDPLDGVLSFVATGCGGVTCSQNITSVTMTPATSTAGGQVTITIPTDQCTCDGYAAEVVLTSPTGAPITANSTADPRTFTATIPAGNGTYTATARCCPV